MRNWLGLFVFAIALAWWADAQRRTAGFQAAEADVTSARESAPIRDSKTSSGPTFDPEFSFATAPAAAGSSARTPLQKLQSLEQCLGETNPCKLADSYPRQLEDLVSDRVLRSLRELRGHASAQDPEAAAIALWALRFPEEKVRLEGMEWAERFLHERDRAHAVIESLTDSIAIPLYDRGLELLRGAYGSAPDEIDAFLEATLRTGAHFAIEETARLIGGFLNDRNVARFESVLETMPAGSNPAISLRSNIDDFKRRRSGG